MTGVLGAGQQPAVTSPAFTLSSQTTAPRQASSQAVVVSSQAVSRLLSPSLSSNTVQLPTFNVLQRQLSAPGKNFLIANMIVS